MDKYSSKKRSEIMAAVKSSKTGPEEKVALLLRQLKIKSRRNVKSLPRKPDFVIESANMIIFVHGCFWHGHANCSKARCPKSNVRFWQDKVVGNMKRDRRVCRQLRKEGWHIITIWQCRLRNPGRVKKRLERFLKR